MRAIKLLGGSAIAFYLVCMVMAVVSMPLSADQAASPDVVMAQPADTAPDVAVEPTDEVGFVDSVMQKVPEWVKLGGLITTMFSVIAAATPTPKDDGWVMLIRKLIDAMAFNVGHAKSAAELKQRYGIR